MYIAVCGGISLSLCLPLSLLGRYREKMAGSAVTPAA